MPALLDKYTKLVRAVPFRVKLLATGKSVWVDDKGREIKMTDPWSLRWAIAGVHSHRWWWVRRWGKQACGCTLNPLTRRPVLYSFDCPTHLKLDPLADDD